MGVLDKKTTMFERDSSGKLIPTDVELVIDENDMEQLALKGTRVFLIPLPRGDLRKFFNSIRKNQELREKMSPEEKDTMDNDFKYDFDAQLVLSNCVEPKYTEDEVKFVKGGIITAIVNTILFVSGIDTKKNKKREKAFAEAEDEFGKN